MAFDINQLFILFGITRKAPAFIVVQHGEADNGLNNRRFVKVLVIALALQRRV